MAAPEGYTKLGNVGYADKGVYSADATYNKYNVVYYEGSTYVALKDNLHGVTPANGENWRYMAKGFNEASADGITVIDTSGIIDGTKNKKTILQTFLDKVGDFIINKAVTNEALLLKLADYVAKTDIVQTESTATDKVPSSAYLKQALGTINSNFAAERYTGNIDGLFKNCVVQLFSSLGTTGTFPESDINGSFLHVVNNGSDFCFQQLNIITNKNTTSYKRSWYYGNDTVYPGWSDWRKVITNSDLPILTVRTGTRYWTQYTEVSGQKRIYFYNADFPSGNNLLGYIALTK